MWCILCFVWAAQAVSSCKIGDLFDKQFPRPHCSPFWGCSTSSVNANTVGKALKSSGFETGFFTSQQRLSSCLYVTLLAHGGTAEQQCEGCSLPCSSQWQRGINTVVCRLPVIVANWYNAIVLPEKAKQCVYPCPTLPSTCHHALTSPVSCSQMPKLFHFYPNHFHSTNAMLMQESVSARAK